MAKWNRGKRKRERRKFSEFGKPTPRQVINMARSYEHPDQMVALGPFVEAEFAVPPELRDKRNSQDSNAPLSMRGAFLIDTGAEVSLISTAVIRNLDLPSVDNLVGLQEGEIPPGLYWAELAFHVKQVDREDRVGVVRKFGAAPGLEHTGNPDDPDDGLLGVLGRDFLKYAHLSYDGPRAEFRLEILQRELLADSLT